MRNFNVKVCSFFIAAICLALTSFSAYGDDYWISQLRAAPGNLPALLELTKTTDWKSVTGAAPIIMRHSQGNQWDLMIVGKVNTKCEKLKCETYPTLWQSLMKDRFNQLADYQTTFLATSKSTWPDIQKQAASAGLFHIEMFNAAAGKYAALLRQRNIENDYLARTGQLTNVIFEVTIGSDVDIFTIGFHQNLASFAKDAPFTSEQKEAAAVEAGFKNRADISFHLRELIVSHHDTLAVPVK